MAPIRTEDFTTTLFTLLDETFACPPRPDGNAYLDRQTGWVDTLAGVSAEQASRPVAPGATTVAAQVEHARFYLEVIESFMLGRGQKVDWRDSWSVREVATPEAWDDLKRRFLDAQERVTALLRTTERWDEDRIGDALSILIHSAYHLGAVRQMLRVVR